MSLKLLKGCMILFLISFVACILTVFCSLVNDGVIDADIDNIISNLLSGSDVSVFQFDNRTFKAALMNEEEDKFNPSECYMAVHKDVDAKTETLKWHIYYICGQLANLISRLEAAQIAILLFAQLRANSNAVLYRQLGEFTSSSTISEVYRYFKHTTASHDSDECDLYLLEADQGDITAVKKLDCKNPSEPRKMPDVLKEAKESELSGSIVNSLFRDGSKNMRVPYTDIYGIGRGSVGGRSIFKLSAGIGAALLNVVLGGGAVDIDIAGSYGAAGGPGAAGGAGGYGNVSNVGGYGGAGGPGGPGKTGYGGAGHGGTGGAGGCGGAGGAGYGGAGGSGGRGGAGGAGGAGIGGAGGSGGHGGKGGVGGAGYGGPGGAGGSGGSGGDGGDGGAGYGGVGVYPIHQRGYESYQGYYGNFGRQWGEHTNFNENGEATYCIVLRTIRPTPQAHFACGMLANKFTKLDAVALYIQLSKGFGVAKTEHTTLKEAYAAIEKILSSNEFKKNIEANIGKVAGRNTPLFKISSDSYSPDPVLQPLVQNQLKSQNCYILDTDSAAGVFLWVGQGVDRETLLKCSSMLEMYFYNEETNFYRSATIVEEGRESIYFKVQFVNWQIDFPKYD